MVKAGTYLGKLHNAHASPMIFLDGTSGREDMRQFLAWQPSRCHPASNGGTLIQGDSCVDHLSVSGDHGCILPLVMAVNVLENAPFVHHRESPHTERAISDACRHT